MEKITLPDIRRIAREALERDKANTLLPATNGVMSEPATAHLPDPRPDRCDFHMAYPYRLYCDYVTAETHGLVYNAYHAMCDELGIPKDKRPVLAVGMSPDPTSSRNDNAFYSPHFVTSEQLATGIVRESDVAGGPGIILFGQEYGERHTLESWLGTLAHELGHAEQYRADPPHAVFSEVDKYLRLFLNYGELPPETWRRTPERSVIARDAEKDADGYVMRLMGARVHEDRSRRDAGYYGTDFELSASEARIEKISSHPDPKRRVAEADAEKQKQQPIRLTRRDGSIVER